MRTRHTPNTVYIKSTNVPVLREYKLLAISTFQHEIFKVEIEKIRCILSKRPHGHVYMAIQVRIRTCSSMYRHG